MRATAILERAPVRWRVLARDSALLSAPLPTELHDIVAARVWPMSSRHARALGQALRGRRSLLCAGGVSHHAELGRTPDRHDWLSWPAIPEDWTPRHTLRQKERRA